MKKEIFFSDNIKDWDIEIIQSVFVDYKIINKRFLRKAIWQFPLEIYLEIWNEIKDVIELLENNKITDALGKKYSSDEINFHIKQIWKEIIISKNSIWIIEKWEWKSFNDINQLLKYLWKLKEEKLDDKDFKLEIKGEKICVNYKWFPFHFKSELDWKDLVWFIKWWLDSYVKSWLQIWEMKKDIIKYIMTVSITLIWVIIWVIIKAPNSSISWFLNTSLFLFFISILISVWYWAFYINFWKDLMEKLTKESFLMFKKIDWENTIEIVMKFINNFINLAKKLNKEKYLYYSILSTFVLWLISLISSFIFK